MTYIEMESTDAAFHFSVEEYVMAHFPPGEAVMMIWQADNCAMLGSNQLAEAEINIRYAESEKIQIVRRSSGGGTIFTDLGTLLYTVILPHANSQDSAEISREITTGQLSAEAARLYTAGQIIEALAKLGVPAKLEGRNDILADGKKFSGMAQYSRHGKVCTHGSLLYDTDLDKLTEVLRVDDEKISSKALRSVRSRVTNIKKYMNHDYSTLEFWGLLRQALLCGKQVHRYNLTDSDLANINQIYQERYGNPAWTFERAQKFTFHNSKRFAGGKVEVYLDVDSGAVRSCQIRGDFLGILPVRGLETLLTGIPFRFQAFDRALDGVSIGPYLGNIGKDEFLSCVFN